MEILMILLITFLVLLIGRVLKDFPLVSFAGMILVIDGIYLIGTGINNIEQWFSGTLGLIILAIGLYVFLRSPYETYKKDKLNPEGVKKLIKGVKNISRKRK